MINQNRIKVYHFINYQRNDLINYLSKSLHNNSLICLDLEDSVQDVFMPENNAQLKQLARNTLREIFVSQNYPDVKWSIRLNSLNSNYFEADINLLRELKPPTALHSLLLPKTESGDEIKNFTAILQNIKLNVEEIIPIIETGKGFDNIESILGLNDIKIRRVVFGHCDFNYDNNIFPFFHQNSREYWDWIQRLYSAAKLAGKEFVNSAYLKLNDNEGFTTMLSRLNEVCNGNFGQVALNYKQVDLCRTFKSARKALNGFDKYLYGKEIQIYAENIVKDFESNNECKGFSIAGKIRNLISPHEYSAAKKYLMTRDGN